MALEDVVRGSRGRAPPWGASEALLAGLHGGAAGAAATIGGQASHAPQGRPNPAPATGYAQAFKPTMKALAVAGGARPAATSHPQPDQPFKLVMESSAAAGGARPNVSSRPQPDQASKKIANALPRDQEISMLMQSSRWQSWQALLDKLYSKERLLMIDGIRSACTSPPL